MGSQLMVMNLKLEGADLKCYIVRREEVAGEGGGGGGGVARPKYSAEAINAHNKARVEAELSDERMLEREERLERIYRFQEAGRLSKKNLIRQYVSFEPFIERRRAFLREKGSKWVTDEAYAVLFGDEDMDVVDEEGE